MRINKTNASLFALSAVLFPLFAAASTSSYKLEEGKAALARYAEENSAPARPAFKEPVFTPSEMSVQPQRDWTVMIYMNGRSNVEAFALEDMNELELAGSTDRVNVVTELGRMTGTEGNSGPDGKWTGSRRFFVIKDADTSAIKSPALWQNPKPDMGDYHQVVAFVQWARKTFPAKKYALIIWDHGWGWMDPSKPMTRSISHDFVTGHAIKTTELKAMFSQMGQMDMYASMACFMQMMEVSYEVKDYAKVVVGSEEVIQLPSFDFDAFLNLLSAKPQADAEDAGKFLVKTFKDLYSQPGTVAPGYGVQLSAMRTDKMVDVKSAMDKWIKLVSESGDAQALKIAMRDVIRFEVGDESTDPDKKKSPYADLGHFIKLFNANMTASTPEAQAARAAGEALLATIKGMTVAQAGFGKDRVGNDFADTTGIAIDIPGKPGEPLLEHDDSYGKLDFIKNSAWGKFHSMLEELNKPKKKS